MHYNYIFTWINKNNFWNNHTPYFRSIRFYIPKISVKQFSNIAVIQAMRHRWLFQTQSFQSKRRRILYLLKNFISRVLPNIWPKSFFLSNYSISTLISEQKNIERRIIIQWKTQVITFESEWKVMLKSKCLALRKFHQEVWHDLWTRPQILHDTFSKVWWIVKNSI